MQNPIHLLHYGWGKKLPVIIQTEVAECGLASMAMVANYYGHKLDLNGLRRKYSISSKGATLQGLIQLADHLQLSSRPLRLELEELSQLKTPCILHWNLNHFVVLKSVRGNKVTIHDPGVGVRELKLDVVSKHFTGVALELTPTPDFKPEKIAKRAKLSHFWSRITGLKRTLIQILILSILLQVFAIATPFYMQLVVDDVIISRDLDLLIILALGFGLMKLVNLGVTALRSVVILYMGTQLNIQMAANLLRHLLKLPMDYFEKRHIGDIISRFGSLEDVKQLLTTGLIETIVDGIMAIGLLVMMFIYSTTLALIVLGAVVLYIMVRLGLYRPYRQLTEEVIVADAKQSSNFMETVRGMQSIKLFGNESQRQTVWHNYYADAMNTSIKVGKLDIGYNFINGFLFGLENIIVIYLAASSVMDSLMTIGMLYAFMSYKQQFTDKASALVNKFIQFKMLSLHMERLGDIILSDQEKDIDSQRQLPLVTGELKLDNVSFRYSDNEPYLFKGLNFEIAQGSSVAIVGASGCGKTTIMKIMLGLLKPETGTVMIDGYDIRKVGLRSYRNLIGTVMQNDQLLSGSIADNICFFDPEFDQSWIEQCAQQAAIHNDIMAMPMGYHTLIGDMGSSLSGGQKQRLLLARALYKRPKILFLDEATSHLDVGLESVVNQTVKKLNITRIIIAHRPDTIAMADKVVALQNGQLLDVHMNSQNVAV
ncbi:peptidase domain-containing ABC transporter [Aquimarina sp. D1M17]|uniref:peptidase domain-containing ABC transporter n=1 Tax=Aquimarina acroporae TaxID=2937283 RepID=UPI0020BEDA32|nr:peptidase domain-containing ABC transporter [Aquimarina acroporae]MCK8524436.1 peptidase domain-containing ABC transporter [Aquimarina acroporae]